MVVDGLGGEEINQTVNVQTDYVNANISVSGLNVFAQGSGTFGRVTNADGPLFPIVRNSGTSPTFGARIQFGSVVTGAEGFGSALFNTAFASTQYYWNAQIGSSSTFLSVDAGSWNVTISGPAGRNISGVVFKGGPSTVYNWVAIGL